MADIKHTLYIEPNGDADFESIGNGYKHGMVNNKGLTHRPSWISDAMWADIQSHIANHDGKYNAIEING